MMLNSPRWNVSMQIPRGARLIGIPGSESPENPRGLMVEVYWDQDDTGTLCISGHSSEIPIPPSVSTRSASSATSQTTLFGRRAPVLGFVIDPSEIQTPTGQ